MTAEPFRVPQRRETIQMWIGRRIHPYALAVSLATASLTWNVASDRAVGVLLNGPAGHFVGVVAGLSVVLMTLGWWLRRDTWRITGLLATVGVWTTVAAVVALDTGIGSPSALLAACWAIGSAGAWFVEVNDPEAP